MEKFEGTMQSFASYCKDNDIQTITEVRVNKKGLLFVSCINSEEGHGNCENIYFSKKITDVKVGDLPMDINLANASIASFTTKEGIDMIRLTFGQSSYTSTALLFADTKGF